MQKPHLVSLVVGVAVIAATVTPSVAFAHPTAHAAASRTVSATTLLKHLSVKTETHASTYARSKFTGWIDADHDGEDTRAEVLKAESSKKATVTRSGTVTSGRWTSRYDGVTVTAASKLDIDHLVPLQEAWVSGASGWTALKREAYANDIGASGTLIAVTAHANRSKGDREPNRYLPAKKSYRCTYVKNYIAVKARWHLSVNAAEKTALGRDLSRYCTTESVQRPTSPNIVTLIGTTSTPKPTRTPTRTSTPTPSATSTPVATPSPTATPTTTATSTAIPAPTPSTSASATSSYYANCTAVRAAGAAPLYSGQPGYRSALDRDGDGVACES